MRPLVYQLLLALVICVSCLTIVLFLNKITKNEKKCKKNAKKASGIGKALVIKCLKNGMNVAMVDINWILLSSLKQSLSNEYPSLRINCFKCDVSNLKEMIELRSKIESYFKCNSIQYLFNNAGVGSFASLITGDLIKLRKAMDIKYQFLGFSLWFASIFPTFGAKQRIKITILYRKYRKYRRFH